MNKFPGGWKTKRLGDCLETLKSGKVAERGWSPQCLDYPVESHEVWGVLKTTAVQMGEYQSAHNKQLPTELEPKKHLEVMDGDFLLTTTGPRNRCGVVCHVKSTPANLIFSGKILRFRANQKILLSNWLMFLLMSPEYQKLLDKLKVGSSDSSVSIGNRQILDLDIPVPPIDEQRKIVEILEDYLSRLDAACVDVTKSLGLIDILERSIFDQAWYENDLVYLKDILSEPLRNGVSGNQTSDSGGTPTLTLTAVTRGNFEENIKLTTTSSKKAEGLWLKKGDIFIQRSNAPRLVGTAAAYRGVDGVAIFPDLLIRLRVDQKKADWRWVEAVLKSESARKYFRTCSKGLSGSMPKISQPDILNLKIPLPSLEDQKNAIIKIEREYSLVLEARKQISFVKGEADSLRGSLLQAAITGQLIKEVLSV